MIYSFNIRLPDPEQHGYAQKYCFLNGPDPQLNRELRKAVLESTIPLGEERDSHRIEFLSIEKQEQIVSQVLTTLEVPENLELSKNTIADWTKDLGWKVAAIPETAASVLVLGTSTCREALFIRNRLPHARIECVDFTDSRLPGVEQTLDIQFHQEDFVDTLARSERSFDVIFSNHVLEHLFNPGKVLKLVKRALAPGGSLVSALPLDGQPGTPFSRFLNTTTLHPLDMCKVDVAHAWKTNISELIRELSAAGFVEYTFAGRDKYFSASPRAFPDRAAFDRRRRRGLLWNAIVFGTAREALKIAFPHNVPRLVTKALFGIEHRIWFGSNRLKNESSLECLVTAK